MPASHRQRILENGLTVLIEPMPWLRSAALGLALPAGCQYEPPERFGLAGVVCEMVQRGAGRRSSRDLVADQDNLGIDRMAQVTAAHTVFGASMPADSLDAALELFADIVRRPHLPQDQLDDAIAGALQELRALLDEPPQRVMTRLKELHYGAPLGHNPLGTLSALEAITPEEVRGFFQRHYRPSQAILAIAGRVDPDRLTPQLDRLFASWEPLELPSEPPVQSVGGWHHIEYPSQQTHIGFAFPAISYGHPDYFKLRAAVGILSDGMSSRLFDRVREQRGLCYAISAGCHSLRGAGGVFGYAGTTPQRAQETLDVTLDELHALGEGIDAEELDRLKVRVQSGLVMDQESSISRAAAMVSDWYHRGRVLTMSELQQQIEALRPTDLLDCWNQHPPRPLRVLTLGPEPLHNGDDVSRNGTS